jgi:malate dehydrogenase (oxaloacetate-decarboxylating)
MSVPSASFSITMRVELADPHGVGAITTAVGDAGGVVTALDVVESRGDALVVDMACNAFNEGHAERLTAAVEAVDGAHVRAMSDRTMLLHLGGKLEIASRVPLRTRDDLSMAYTPGVARVSMAIVKDPSAVRNLTIKRNTVAVVTDGSAVLGLGNIGPEAAMPVMEGKALLFKRFAGVDAWPICLATQDTDEIVRIVECLAPGFGGINLEDIAAPRCFEVEERLRAKLDIPVFHDDQHGTAVVVFAALTNALRVVGKQMKEVRVVVLGIGAAGVAVTKLLLAEGVGDVVTLNRRGILVESTPGLDEPRRWIATHTNREGRVGGIAEAVDGADVLIGVSGPNLVTEEHLAKLGKDAIVFALANPTPEVDSEIARRYAAIVATGRSDEPNQINNVLVFPGFFRGLLNVGAKKVTEEMKLEAGRALAAVVADEELSPAYIIPTVFNPAVVPAVSSAVERVASSSMG